MIGRTAQFGAPLKTSIALEAEALADVLAATCAFTCAVGVWHTSDLFVMCWALQQSQLMQPSYMQTLQ